MLSPSLRKIPSRGSRRAAQVLQRLAQELRAALGKVHRRYGMARDRGPVARVRSCYRQNDLVPGAREQSERPERLGLRLADSDADRLLGSERRVRGLCVRAQTLADGLQPG